MLEFQREYNFKECAQITFFGNGELASCARIPRYSQSMVSCLLFSPLLSIDVHSPFIFSVIINRCVFLFYIVRIGHFAPSFFDEFARSLSNWFFNEYEHPYFKTFSDTYSFFDRCTPVASDDRFRWEIFNNSSFVGAIRESRVYKWAKILETQVGSVWMVLRGKFG